ncbi:MAG TPA: DUF5615 family PIN-like protein [Phycisphaerae bacterium]|nr:DUF5615 family PIN-like protein [Phycisphaerae bacterium]
MLRLLADENFNQDIVRGLWLRLPTLDLITLLDLGGAGLDDPSVLLRAAQENRILLTHDRATMPNFAYQHLAAGHHLPGVFILHDRLSVGAAIDELLLIVACSEQHEWEGRIVYLPLS